MASNRRPQARKGYNKKTSPYKPEKRIRMVGSPTRPKYKHWDEF